MQLALCSLLLCCVLPAVNVQTHERAIPRSVLKCGSVMQVRDCGSLLTVGGFNIPAVDVDDITIHYKDFKGIVSHLRYSTYLTW